jgi:hypothetical protein
MLMQLSYGGFRQQQTTDKIVQFYLHVQAQSGRFITASYNRLLSRKEITYFYV